MSEQVFYDPVINDEYIKRVSKWTPDYDGIRAVINDPEIEYPEFGASNCGRAVMRGYKEETTILTDYLLACRPNYRRGAQGIGDCVSWGTAFGVDMLVAKYYALRKKPHLFWETATEPIYGGCRVEALGKKTGGWSDGAYGAAAAKWVNKWGVVPRKDFTKKTGNEHKYKESRNNKQILLPHHDYSVYSAKRAKQEGYYGAGGQYDQGAVDLLAKLKPVKTVSRIHNFDEAAAVIAGSHCPVAVASMAGFGSMKRDRDGFCRISGRWAHQMVFVGVRFDKPGLLIAQSWGSRSSSGPRWPHDLPDNIAGFTWWVSEKDCNWMFGSGDCWAYSDVGGWEIEKADWRKSLGKIKARKTTQSA